MCVVIVETNAYSSSSSSSTPPWIECQRMKATVMIKETYGSVGGLLLLVALLVGLGLGIVGLLLLVAEVLPLLTELLADLACDVLVVCFDQISSVQHTELDAGVVLADLVALLVGEEHVGRKTALGLVGV